MPSKKRSRPAKRAAAPPRKPAAAKKPAGRNAQAATQTLKAPLRKQQAPKQPARKQPARPAKPPPAPRPAAASLVADPGGYAVFDAARLTGNGQSEEVGRVVRGERGFEAWNKVAGGYRRVGRFAQSEQAIMALGGAAGRRRAATPPAGEASGRGKRVGRGAEIVALAGRRKRR